MPSMFSRTFCTAAVVAVSLAGPAPGAEFVTVSAEDGTATWVAISGPIEFGDFQRMFDWFNYGGLGRVTPDQLRGFTFNSPGGNMMEAAKFANFIHSGYQTYIVDSSECVSACFLMFAAGSVRSIESNAALGVHSVSTANREDPAGTIVLTRVLAKFGVPPAILGKIALTTPDQVTWLDPADLGSWVISINTAKVRRPPPEGPSAAFAEGLAARQAYETWFADLSGQTKEGAAWWAAHRSLSNHSSCGHPQTLEQAEWTSGCMQAKWMLDLSDPRRRNEPNYRAGWNSFQ